MDNDGFDEAARLACGGLWGGDVLGRLHASLFPAERRLLVLPAFSLHLLISCAQSPDPVVVALCQLRDSERLRARLHLRPDQGRGRAVRLPLGNYRYQRRCISAR